MPRGPLPGLSQAPPLVLSSSFPSMPPLYSQSPIHILWDKFPIISETVHSSSELVRAYFFQISLFEDTEAKSLISYIPWTKS